MDVVTNDDNDGGISKDIGAMSYCNKHWLCNESTIGPTVAPVKNNLEVDDDKADKVADDDGESFMVLKRCVVSLHWMDRVLRKKMRSNKREGRVVGVG